MSWTVPQLNFGSLALDFPVVLAAMSGYTDWPTRRIARGMGAGYTLSEVLLDRFVVDVTKGRKARRFVRVTDDDHPVGAQIMGHSAPEMAAAARKLVEAGFDCVDVNFGCPVRKVLSKCRGGHLLSDPTRALEIVARVREAVPPEMPVTVKMRRGTDESHQSQERFFAIFDGVFEQGAAAVTVHGRTVQQRYEGPSSWEFLREVKLHAAGRTVLGSGDLFTARACLDMIAETGVDGVTAARGAIGNPWIFRDARALAAGRPLPPPPTLFEQRDAIAEHYRLAEEVYGPGRCPFVMRKFGIKYSRLHPQSEQVRDAFVAVGSAGQWKEVLDRWYSEDLPGQSLPSSIFAQ
ncbi:MAG: tRNA-dihydrouridine synthase [Planctomycetes bacterium]|nr:tRNA-dihydrouridine synthase [Planctomycetota bacterium]